MIVGSLVGFLFFDHLIPWFLGLGRATLSCISALLGRVGAGGVRRAWPRKQRMRIRARMMGDPRIKTRSWMIFFEAHERWRGHESLGRCWFRLLCSLRLSEQCSLLRVVSYAQPRLPSWTLPSTLSFVLSCVPSPYRWARRIYTRE